MMHPLILQSDFGLSDGAVSAMHGVSYSVNHQLRIFDLTHDIRPYNIWEASYRLIQTVEYWPSGSVFVSVVDPGVGSNRKNVVVKTKSGQYIVTPDNGTLTHIKQKIGIAEARIIDENTNRLPNSKECYTFHGRDIFAYTGARLASGLIQFEEVGKKYDVEEITMLKTIEPSISNNAIQGTIDVLDIRFGSLWTNIPTSLFKQLQIKYGEYVLVTIEHEHRIIFKNILSYVRSFADVSVGETLLYSNSLDCMALAINQGSFAKAYNVGTGWNWIIKIQKINIKD